MDLFRLFIVVGGATIALLGVAKAYLEYAATKAKTRTNESGESHKDNPRS